VNEQACAPTRMIRAGANSALSLPVAWAAVCGLLAGGAAALSGLQALYSMAAWLVADIALGSVWAQLAALKAHEVTPFQETSDVQGCGWVLPYAEPGSRGRRLRVWVARHASDRDWTLAAGLAVGAALLALVVTTLLGPWPLLVAAIALVGIALGALLTRDPLACGDLGRGLQAAAAWLMVRVIVAPWQRWAWLPALCAGLWVWALPGMLRHNRAASWLARAAYAAAVTLLLINRQAIAATGVALAALGAELALGRRPAAQPIALQAPWLASALLLALAGRYWG